MHGGGAQRRGPGRGVGWALGSVLSVTGLLPGKVTRGNKMGHERAAGRLAGAGGGAYARTLRGPGLGTPGTHLPGQESQRAGRVWS